MKRNRSPGASVATVLMSSALILGSCSGGSGGGSAAAAECPVHALDDATGAVGIEMWHSMTGSNATVLGRLVDEYNAARTDVRVTLVFQGSYDESLSKYIANLGGGELPDLLQTEETAMALMVDSDSTVPAEACVTASGYDTSDYLAGLLDQYRVDGRLVTMPFQLSNPVLYYDRARFRAAGLDPDQPPVSYADVVSAAQKLKASGAVKRAPVALDADAWFIEQWMAKAGAPFVDHDNGRNGHATKVLLDSDAGRNAFGFLADLQSRGLLMTAGGDSLAKYLAVASGDAAMTIGSTASLGTIYDQLALFPGVDVGVAALPGPSDGGVTVGGGSLWMVARSSDAEKAAAWNFQQWLNEPAQQAQWSIGTGYVPSRVTAIDDPEITALWAKRPGFRVAYEQIVGAKRPPGGGGPVIGDYAGVRKAVELAMEKVMAGSDVDGAIADAARTADQAIAAYTRRVGN